MYGSQKNIIPDHENEAKIDNDYVLRNDHRIKTTLPISMILVSFFSEDNLIKSKYARFSNIKVTKMTGVSLFLGHPVYVKNKN